MTLPATDTIVLYPDGAVESEGIVLHRETLADGRVGLVLDSTAFHAVDAAWPDQPADRGTIRAAVPDADEVVVEDAVVGATDGDRLFVGTDVPVKKGTEGWAFLVVHVVAADSPIDEGDAVVVTVDAAHRHALSAGHTACHLASLALNRALTDAWRKDVMTDAMGVPNFDALAIESSTILPDGSVDVYRIGKSLRRKGFVPESLTDLEDLARRVDATLADWVASGAPAGVERSDDRLTGRREWVCALPSGRVSIPCGGTHVGALDAFDAVTVRFDASSAEGAIIVTMTTAGVARA